MATVTSLQMSLMSFGGFGTSSGSEWPPPDQWYPSLPGLATCNGRVPGRARSDGNTESAP